MRRAALAATVCIGLGALGCEGRPRAAAEEPTKPKYGGAGSIAEIDLSRGAPERTVDGLFGPTQKRTHADLIRVLGALDPGGATKGVYVRLGGATFGLARAQEIGAALGRVRAKVPVVCQADDYNNTSFYVAAAGCTRIWVSPAGGVDTVGIAAQLVFARSLFDKFDVAVDFLQVGKFKGAEEPMTRDGPSPEARASLEGTLQELRTAWVGGIVAGRNQEGIADAIEDGPFGPEEAKRRGLVDAIGYQDDAKDDAKALAKVDTVSVRFGTADAAAPVPKGLTGVMRAISGSSSGGAHIAVVPAVGPITMAPARGLLGASEGINERDLGKVVAKLTKDESTKAVVVRIDSPGGSALASDLLWKKLMKLRAKKPVVFSIGGMAASGGYYLSCTASKIVAEPGSIVGSIGVVGGKLAFGKTLERYGVHAVTVPASTDATKGARAAYMSVLEPWDDATRARVLASMTEIYDLFLKRVAEGRGLDVDEVAPSAEGRIFGGLEAQRRKLVDEIGGFEDALKLAAKLADLPDDAPVEIVNDETSLVDLLENGADDGDEERAAATVAVAVSPEVAALLPGLREKLAESPELMSLTVALSPMLTGERALTTLPYGLSFR